MNRCPKCDRHLIMFGDYDRNDFDALGIKCRSSICGYRLTFGGLLNHAESVIKCLEDTPEEGFPAHLMEAGIREMRKTISEGM